MGVWGQALGMLILGERFRLETREGSGDRYGGVLGHT